jgi:uncharacterized iron-regulated protein
MPMLQRALTSLAAFVACIGIAVAGPMPPVPAAVAPLAREHPLAGRIVQLSDGAEVTPQRLAEIAASRAFILLGEKHDNPDHHRLQAWLIEALVASGRRPTVAMEMLDADQAPALADYRKNVPADASGLGAAIGWSTRGWPDWSIYEPIAGIAFRAGLPIVPADLTRDSRRAVSRGGVDALDPASRARIAHAPRFDADQTASLTQELRLSHCGHLPDTALPRMADVQWARDAHMAAALLDAARNAAPAVLIAGAGHVRADRGVPWHLRQAAPHQTIFTLAFVEVDDSRLEMSEYPLRERFEYAWFTPRVDDEDPCAKFRDSLQRLRRP